MMTGIDIVKLSVLEADLLLQVHKTALLAIEKQAQKIAVEKVLKAQSNQAKLRVARLILRSVQVVSSRLAWHHAKSEFELHDIDIDFNKPKMTQTYIDKLVTDLSNSFQDPNMTPEEKARRAGLAAVSLANRAYSDMQLLVFNQVSFENQVVVEKIWVVNRHAATPPCAQCIALDGTVVAVDSEFMVAIGYKVYSDLQGPPLHPNCRCRLLSRVRKD